MSDNTISFSMNPLVMSSNLTIVNDGGTLWSITGRIPRQDNDHTHFVLCHTVEQAYEAFTANAYIKAGRVRPMPGDEGFDEDDVICITDTQELGVRLAITKAHTSLNVLPVQVSEAVLPEEVPLPVMPVEAAATEEYDDDFTDPGLFTPGLPDLPVTVTAIDGTSKDWMISPNLTDRWGGVNTYACQQKPLHELLLAPGLLDELREQMTEELTFVARKDGLFGLLYEVEYESIESDGGDLGSEGLKPYAEVAASLLSALQKNAHRFEPAELCVPPAEEICNDRPAVWAFVPNGALDEDARAELAQFLESISLH